MSKKEIPGQDSDSMNCSGTWKSACAMQGEGWDFSKSFPTVTPGAAGLERGEGLCQDQPLALHCSPQPRSVGPNLKDRHLCPFPSGARGTLISLTLGYVSCPFTDSPKKFTASRITWNLKNEEKTKI